MGLDSTAVHRPQKQLSLILFACAGLIITIVAIFGQILSSAEDKVGYLSHSGETELFILLGMLVISILLAIVALTRTASWALSIDRPQNQGGWYWLVFAMLVGVHLLLIFSMMHPGKEPQFDVYAFQRNACGNLLRGIDPFGGTQADPFNARQSSLFYSPAQVAGGRVLVGFQYTPLTLVWALPGYLLGDLRISYILAVIVSAWILFALCPDARGLFIVSVLLFSPLTLLMELLSFTEPLTLMTLCGTIYAAVKGRRWLPIVLGLFLASKQYNLLALPLIVCLIPSFRWKDYLRLAGLSVMTAAATILPFALWNLKALWHDMILFHLRQPYRFDAVSLAVPFPWIRKFGPLLVLGFVVWIARTRNRSAAMFPAAYGVALLLFFMVGMAFANYYFLAGQTFFVSIAALSATREHEAVQLLPDSTMASV